MTSASLRIDQIQAMLRTLKKHHAYLDRLNDRMETNRFPRHDELNRAANRAQSAMTGLLDVLKAMERHREAKQVDDKSY